jgi:hypothetical protein
MATDCVICSRWPEPLRQSMRLGIDALPLPITTVCDPCIQAFINHFPSEGIIRFVSKQELDRSNKLRDRSRGN